MLLALLFFLIAILYASVGFGGGSSYLALLALWGTPFVIMPAIALICNILVVSGNCLHYTRAGFLNWRLFLPPTIFSVPMAYLGGRINIDQTLFTFVLAISLSLAGLRLLFTHKQYTDDQETYNNMPVWASGLLGGGLGFLSGLVGIGGGIFLAPVLYHLRVGKPKEIALTASLFILVNSIAGLIGQFQKSGISSLLLDYWYLPLVVLVGGQLGNFLTIKVISSRIMTLITALLIIFVSGRLLLSLL